MGRKLGDESYHWTNKLRGQGEADVSYVMILYRPWKKHPKGGRRDIGLQQRRRAGRGHGIKVQKRNVGGVLSPRATHVRS